MTAIIGSIIAAVITGGLALIGVIYSSNRNAEKTTKAVEAKLATQQAVTEVKIDALTSEVREHNNFARRIPVIEEQIRAINHRIDDLERFHAPKP